MYGFGYNIVGVVSRRWVWQVGMVSRMWVECMGLASGCG